MTKTPSIAADLEGPVSPPRDNGEIVFAAPWERRAFGITVALCRSQAYKWESFRRRLITRIAEDQMRPYWQSWTVALEDLLAETDTLTPGELDARHQAFLARPPGHDHNHLKPSHAKSSGRA